MLITCSCKHSSKVWIVCIIVAVKHDQIGACGCHQIPHLLLTK